MAIVALSIAGSTAPVIRIRARSQTPHRSGQGTASQPARLRRNPYRRKRR
jgi:hypothetical protein